MGLFWSMEPQDGDPETAFFFPAHLGRAHLRRHPHRHHARAPARLPDTDPRVVRARRDQPSTHPCGRPGLRGTVPPHPRHPAPPGGPALRWFGGRQRRDVRRGAARLARLPGAGPRLLRPPRPARHPGGHPAGVLRHRGRPAGRPAEHQPQPPNGAGLLLRQRGHPAAGRRLPGPGSRRDRLLPRPPRSTAASRTTAAPPGRRTARTSARARYRSTRSAARSWPSSAPTTTCGPPRSGPGRSPRNSTPSTPPPAPGPGSPGRGSRRRHLPLPRRRHPPHPPGDRPPARPTSAAPARATRPSRRRAGPKSCPCSLA